MVTPLLQFVDISSYSLRDEVRPLLPADRLDDDSLSNVVHRLKGLFFLDTKISVFDAMMAGDANMSVPFIRVVINRIRASLIRETPEKDPLGLASVFGQLFSALRNRNYSDLKGIKNQQLFRYAGLSVSVRLSLSVCVYVTVCLSVCHARSGSHLASSYVFFNPPQHTCSVDFAGEGSIDVGGPYREALTLACADLMSDATPLFIKSPNGVNNVGLNRELYIVNPAAKTSLALEMFEFVGVLFGIALRTKVAIPLDLPSIVWKLLLGDAGDESDVAAFDHLCIQALDNVVGLSEEEVRWSGWRRQLLFLYYFFLLFF